MFYLNREVAQAFNSIQLCLLPFVLRKYETAAMNPEVSHLYHDSHFSGLSGGTLEARERMRAREVNAREERLLRQQDEHLQQAKEVCRKRSRWEQDSVRRDLRAILERTPTFTRTLRDEKQKNKLRSRRGQHLPVAEWTPGVFHPQKERRRNGQVGFATTPGVSKTTQSLLLTSSPPPPPLSSPKNLSNSESRSRLPSVPNGNNPDTVETGKSDLGTSSSPPSKQQQSRANGQHHPQLSKPSAQDCRGTKCTETDRLMPHVKPMRRGQRYGPAVPLGESSHTHGHSQYVAAPRPLGVSHDHGPPVSDPPLSSTDATLGMGQYRGADLRRRSHHAVMAIVRVQARHERRMRQADAALAAQRTTAAKTRRYRFSDSSSRSLKELSELFSSSLSAENASPQGQAGPPQSKSDSKLSWLSVTLPDADMRRSAGDVTDVRKLHHSFGDAGCRPARPRFYSMD